MTGSIRVALGGSLVSNQPKLDTLSDIDLFCYLTGSTLPDIPLLAKQLEMPEEQLRRRTNLIEFRRFLGPFDTNIKFFPIEFMRSYIERLPSLDEQYLEEMESYQHFE